MNPIETLTWRLLDGEITAAESDELERLLADSEAARQIHFSLCQQEGLLRALDTAWDAAPPTMASVKSLASQPPEPPSTATIPSASAGIDVDPVRRRSHGRRRLSRPMVWARGIALALVVAGGMLMVLDLPSPFKHRPAAALLPDEPAVLTNVGPGVQVQQAGTWAEASSGRHLAPEDKIRVPAQSWATLTYQDHSHVLLHPDSEIVFQPPVTEARGAASKRLVLLRGALAAQVAKQAARHSLELGTSNAAARVLGTRLMLNAAENATVLDVLEGQVRLTRTSDGQSVHVTQGQTATARPDADLAVRPLPTRVTQDLVSLYTFQAGTGTVVSDISRNGPAMDLHIADPGSVRWIPGGGLAVDRPTAIGSESAAVKIVQACQQTNELTIEAWIKPALIGQVGPSRIVSLSTDPYHRNFTFAQETTDSGQHDVQAFFLTRLRSTGADENGFPELRTPAGIVCTELTHIAYTRSTTGQALLYVDGVPRAYTTTPGDFSDWDGSFRFYLGNEGTMDRAWLGEYHTVAVYRRALSQQEVLQNFRAALASFPVHRQQASD